MRAKHPDFSPIILQCILAVTLVAPLACKKAVSTEPSFTPVRTGQVQWLSADPGNTYSANIEPNAQVTLAFKSNGYIQSIRQVRGADGRMRSVGEGDWVTKESVLATVQQDEFEQKLTQANAQLANAQSDYDRAKLSFDRTSALFAANAVTEPDYDNAKAQLESAKAAMQNGQATVAEAKLALGYCQLRAPFDAWVVKRNVEIGALVGPATDGFVIADTREVKAVFGVPDTAMKSIRLGRPEIVSTDAVPGPFAGHVSAISPAADPKSRVYSVEVTLPNPANRLKSGMIASITIGNAHPDKRVLVVPLNSIVQGGSAGGFAVFLVENTGDISQVRKQAITLGDAYGNMVAVQAGVRPEDRVVTVGATMITNEEEVRIIP